VHGGRQREAPTSLTGSHPLLTRAVEKLLSRVKDFPVQHVLLPASSGIDVATHPDSSCLFLLDGCSLQTDLGPLAVRCRAHSRCSKVLALLPPTDSAGEEKSRLFSWGRDGFVELHETWQIELPEAIRNILNGQLWVLSEVLLSFVKQTKSFLDSQLLHGHFLTARETQVLQLLMRRLTNKKSPVHSRFPSGR
jgi:DNA-binding NarL/FixJ family response regulator